MFISKKIRYLHPRNLDIPFCCRYLRNLDLIEGEHYE